MSDYTSDNHPLHRIELGNRVEVEWIDSERISLGWATPEDYNAALRDWTTYRTTGYLLNVLPEYALIVMNRSDSGMVGEGMRIPLVCIQAVHVLFQEKAR